MEGYTDPLIQGLNNKPLYWGGDATLPALLTMHTLERGALHPDIGNKSLAFFDGGVVTDDDEPNNYLVTRSYAKWMGETNISRPRYDYNTSIYATEPFPYNPWK